MKKISTVGAVTRNTKTPIKPVLDPNRFSTWNKLLLTLATVFNLIYRAKKNRSDKSQYTKDDVCLSQNFLLMLSQNNAFSSRTEPVKAFVQQRYCVIGLRKTLLSIKYRCFLCGRFDTQNIQPIMAPLPAFRFPTEETKFPFANTGLDFFGPFYIEDKQGKIEKHYGLFLHASLREQSI